MGTEGRQVFAIYSRKSKFTGKGESIENQIGMCREYIRQYGEGGEGSAASAIVYEDEGFSGKDLERPQFKEMMREAKKGRFCGIVVYRLDRISRNVRDFVNLTEELSRMGVRFISVKEQFDTTSSMGRAMMIISSVFSQMERETIAERIRDNLHELAKTGRWLGGNTPTGYRSADVVTLTVDGKQKKACRLEEIPEEMAVVELIFRQFYELRSLTGVDACLLQNGYRTKRGNEFSRFAIRAILTNPVYLIADRDAYRYLSEQGVQLSAKESEFDGKHGVMAYNRTLQERGRAHKVNPMSEWIVAVGKHEGKIPGCRWIEIQEILEQNRSKNYRRPRSNEALLSGILRCGNCGDYMRPKLGKRTRKNGERVFSYLCSKKERSRGTLCAVKNADGNALDQELFRRLGSLREDRAAFLKELEKGRRLIVREDRAREDRVREADGGLAAIRREQKENEGRIGRLVRTLSMVSEESAGYILKQIEELNRRNEELRVREEEVQGESRGMEAEGRGAEIGERRAETEGRQPEIEERRAEIEERRAEIEERPAEAGGRGARTSKKEPEENFEEHLGEKPERNPGISSGEGMFLSWEQMADMMNVRQKRDAVRMLVRQVLWDGEKVDVYLVGSEQS